MQTQTKKAVKVYTYQNDFKEFVKELDAGHPCLIDEEMFYYWLEVLPPVYMDKVQNVVIDGVTYPKRCSFGFVEGHDYITDFWPAGEGRYWALKSNRMSKC